MSVDIDAQLVKFLPILVADSCTEIDDAKAGHIANCSRTIDDNQFVFAVRIVYHMWSVQDVTRADPVGS